MDINYSQAKSIIENNDSFIIAAHQNPDGDAVGSVMAMYYALKKMGKKVCYHLEGEAANMSYLLDSENLEFDAYNLITVDVGDKKLLNASIREKYDEVLLNIDHHSTNLKYAQNTILEASASAACEVLYRFFSNTGIEIDDKIANCLYLGITTDTGCFRYSNASAETFEVVSKLLRFNVDNGEINRIQFESKSMALLEFERMAMNTLKFYFNNKCAVITITVDMFEKTGVEECDIHAVTSMPRTIEGVLVGAVIKQRGVDNYKISIRSNRPVFASDICEELGGGGHKFAAGAEIPGKLEDVTNTVLKAIENHI